MDWGEVFGILHEAIPIVRKCFEVQFAEAIFGGKEHREQTDSYVLVNLPTATSTQSVQRAWDTLWLDVYVKV